MARTHLNSQQLGIIDNANLDSDLAALGNLTTTGALVRTSEGHIDTTTFWGCQDADLNSLSLQVNTLEQIVLDSFLVAMYNTVEYFFNISYNNTIHATKLMLVHTNTSSFISEYATIVTNTELGVFDSDINNGSIRLLFTSYVAAPITIKSVRISIKN